MLVRLASVMGLSTITTGMPWFDADLSCTEIMRHRLDIGSNHGYCNPVSE